MKKLLALALALALMTGLLAGCGGEAVKTNGPKDDDAPKQSAPASTDETSGGEDALATGITPREETLYVAGLMWAPPANHNPISGTAAWPMSGAEGDKVFFYETLYMYNMLTMDIEPLLAESYAWEGNVLTVKLKDMAHWNDGESFTAEDVVYTFEMAKDNSVWWSDAWDVFEVIEAKDDYTVAFTMVEGGNKNMALRQLTNVSMLPRHIWEPKVAEMDFNELRQ